MEDLSSRPPAARATGPDFVQINTVADVGAGVREARKAMGLTQQGFADLAGVGRRFVSELESGKATLEAGKVIAVCRAAGIDVFTARRRETHRVPR